MKYPEWWQRLLAAIIDGVILAVVIYIVQTIFVSFGATSMSGLRILLLIAAIANVAIVVAYKVVFEGSNLQATPGKMVFGLKVGSKAVKREPYQKVFLRTWPWWCSLLNIVGALLLTNVIGIHVALVLIAIFFTFFMPPVGRCIHDKTADLHVVKAGKGVAA